MKKLRLNKERVRVLNSGELSGVRGDGVGDCGPGGSPSDCLTEASSQCGTNWMFTVTTSAAIAFAVVLALSPGRAEAQSDICEFGCSHEDPPIDPPPAPVTYAVQYAVDLRITYTEQALPGLVPATPRALGWSASETTEELCARLGYDSNECYILHECKTASTPAGPTVQCPLLAIPVARDEIELYFDRMLEEFGEPALYWAGWGYTELLGFIHCYDPMWGGVFYCPM